MNLTKWIAALLWLAVGSAQLAAQAPETTAEQVLTLEDAVRRALAKHPLLRQAEIDIATAQLRVAQARSNRLPQIDAGGLAKLGLAGSANLFNLNGLAASPEPEGMAFSANFFQDLLDFKRTAYESRARQAEVEYFNETLRAEESGIVLNVKRAYYAAVRERAGIDASQVKIEHRGLEVRRAASRLRAELGSQLDVERADLGLSRSHLELARASAEYRSSQARLGAAMGEGPARGYALQAPETLAVAAEPLDALLAASLERRAELAAIEARIRAGQAWVRRAEREKYPRLMALFSGGWTRFAELTLSKLLFGGFGIQLPLFTGGRIKATIESTKLALEKTHSVREELERAIAVEVTASHSAVTAALEAVRTADKAVAQAGTAERLEGLRYDHKLASMVEWSDARLELAVATSERDRALCEYKIAEAELDFAVGKRTGY